MVSYGVSHFEAPLYRLIAEDRRCSLKLFMQVHPNRNKKFDTDYKTSVWWGEDILAGYESEHCPGDEMMWGAVRSWRPDVILLYGYAWNAGVRVLWGAWRSHIPVVFRGTISPIIDPRHAWKSRLMRVARIPVLRAFDGWHYGGAYSLRVLQQAGVPVERCYHVPYSVNSNWFLSESKRLVATGAAEAERRRLGVPDSHLALLFIGQASWFKGPDIAIEVFRRFHEREHRSVLLFVGSGAELDATRALAARYQLADHVRFLVFRPSKETVSVYAACDAVLFCSRYETWARSVNEAMLCGKPCFVNRVMPVADDLVIDQKNGFVLDGPDADSYIEPMLRFAALSAAERAQMGEAARQQALQFSYENHLDEAICSLCETARGGNTN